MKSVFSFAMAMFNAGAAIIFCLAVFTEGTLVPPRSQAEDASGDALFLILWAIANAAALFMKATSHG